MCELCLSPFIIRDTNHIHHQNEHDDKVSESNKPSTTNQEPPSVSAPAVPLVEML